MAQSARENVSRRSWLLAGMALPLFRARATSLLTVTFDGDDLHVEAPQLHFLAGKPLDRLKDGNTVVFFSQISLFREDRSLFRRSPERLTVSYDLWEENFKVALSVYPRSASRLSASEAEAWCLDNLAISSLGLDPSRPFWLRLDLRVGSAKETASLAGDSGVSIRGLIELFSRKAGTDEPHWSLEAGPLRLGELTRRAVHRTRNG